MSGTATVATIRETELSSWRLERTLTIDAHETVAEAARKMAYHDVGCLIVLGEKRQVAGIVTERDLVTKVVSRETDAALVPVADIMTRNVVSCNLDTSASKVRHLMTAHNVRHVPVIEEGAPLGMVSSRDILAHELSHYQAVARQQSALLDTIEREHPEVVKWHRDGTGRVVID